MDQFGITLCDSEYYGKKHLVQRGGVHFGDFPPQAKLKVQNALHGLDLDALQPQGRS
jgi:hypothetical protein